MIIPSLLYTAVTILLAFIDACRIKAVWGKKDNIDHLYGDIFAFVSGAVVLCLIGIKFNQIDDLIEKIVFLSFSFIFIRMSVFDIFLNAFRILTKTNPTLRLDYESETTSSVIDSLDLRFIKSFWEKRAIGVAGWFVLYILYRIIFKQ